LACTLIATFLLSFLRTGNHSTVGVYVQQLVTCVQSDSTDQKGKNGPNLLFRQLRLE